jgi:hypothetical protein
VRCDYIHLWRLCSDERHGEWRQKVRERLYDAGQPILWDASCCWGTPRGRDSFGEEVGDLVAVVDGRLRCGVFHGCVLGDLPDREVLDTRGGVWAVGDESVGE